MSVQLTKLLPSAPQIVLSGVLKGVYAAGTDYAPGDVVTYQGGTYIMHTDAAAGTAPTDTAAWQAINSPQAYVESINELSLVNTSTDNTISVDQNGNVGTDVSTDGAVHIENTGNTGIGLGVYTNIGATADAPLVKVHVDNNEFDQAGVHILFDATTNNALYLEANNLTSGTALSIQANGNLMTNALFFGRIDNSSASAILLKLDNDGTGKTIEIDHDDTGSNPSVYIDRDGNNVARIFGLTITVDNAGAGNLVGGIDFSGMSDTEPLFKLTSTDTDLSTKSPETDAEAGWFPVLVGNTTYAVPIYALS